MFRCEDDETTRGTHPPLAASVSHKIGISVGGKNLAPNLPSPEIHWRNTVGVKGGEKVDWPSSGVFRDIFVGWLLESPRKTLKISRAPFRMLRCGWKLSAFLHVFVPCGVEVEHAIMESHAFFKWGRRKSIEVPPGSNAHMKGPNNEWTT